MLGDRIIVSKPANTFYYPDQQSSWEMETGQLILRRGLCWKMESLYCSDQPTLPTNPNLPCFREIELLIRRVNPSHRDMWRGYCSVQKSHPTIRRNYYTGKTSEHSQFAETCKEMELLYCPDQPKHSTGD